MRTADGSRQSASLAASLALHAAAVALLLGRTAVHLKLEPSPLVLTFAESSTRTAGPGERAAELREAAPAAAPAPPAPVDVTNPVEPEPAEVVPVAKPKPATKKSERPPAALRPAPVIPAPAVVPGAGAAIASQGISAGEGGHGDAAHATAPAWAPTARVRYEELLFAWMSRHKDYPMLAQRRGIEGRGSLRVRIDRDGRVIDRSLVSSTGQPLLDDAALDMVRRSSPFPPVPDGYAGSSFEFVAPVEYRLR